MVQHKGGITTWQLSSPGVLQSQAGSWGFFKRTFHCKIKHQCFASMQNRHFPCWGVNSFLLLWGKKPLQVSIRICVCQLSIYTISLMQQVFAPTNNTVSVVRIHPLSLSHSSAFQLGHVGGPHTVSGALKVTQFALTSAFIQLLWEGYYQLGESTIRWVQKAFGSFT